MISETINNFYAGDTVNICFYLTLAGCLAFPGY